MVDLVRDLHERGARVSGSAATPTSRPRATCTCAGPDLPETVAPLGVDRARAADDRAAGPRLGLDPDNPRGLAKVTQTDR